MIKEKQRKTANSWCAKRRWLLIWQLNMQHFIWIWSSMEREQVIPAQVADAPKACVDLFRCARKFRNGCPHSRARLVGALARQPANANI